MKIEEVSKISKNGKEFYKLKIDGKTFTAFDSSEGFKQLENGDVSSGDSCKVEFTEKEGEYAGKPVTYRNIVKFDAVEAGEPIKSSSSQASSVGSKPDWDAKDRRIVRMASISRAIEFYAMNRENIANEVISDESVLGMAKKFEEWVYRSEEK